MTTRSPMAYPSTSAPTSAISPTTSCPNTNGVEVKGEKYGLPFAVIVARSEPQIPLKRVLIFTHCAPITCGSLISARCMHETPEGVQSADVLAQQSNSQIPRDAFDVLNCLHDICQTWCAGSTKRLARAIEIIHQIEDRIFNKYVVSRRHRPN